MALWTYYELKQNDIKDKLLYLLMDFFKNLQQRVVLNGQFFQNAGLPEISILGPLLFLIYINDLPNGWQSNLKLFADNTTLFSFVQNISAGTVTLNHDLTKISEWAVQWKMDFNFVLCKQVQQLLFSQKIVSKAYPSLNFNDNYVNQIQLKKHLGLLLDPNLSFDEHIHCILTHFSVTFLYLLKTSENLWFSDVFRGYRNVTLN